VTVGELPIRPGAAEDFAAIAALLRRAFHDNLNPEQEDVERDIFEPARSLVAHDGDEAVGHAAAFTRELTVPGAVLPAAHVTMVGVAATHRRQGLLTRMMHRQLHEIRQAGRESLAVLWASEGRIYPRFGYGMAAHHLMLEIDAREAGLRRDWQLPEAAPAVDVPRAGLRLRAGEPAAMRKEMETVYERLRPDRPGWSSRNDAWWRYALVDSEPGRGGYTERRAVIVDGPDGPLGYASWQSKMSWSRYGPDGDIRVTAAMAADPTAYAMLWDFLLNLDLSRTVRFHFAAVDEPLLCLVAEPSRLGAQLSDCLWIRLVDVGTALTQRRYATPVDVVIEVTDPILPDNAGRWRLTADGDGATCVRTDDAADLACDVRELGAAYLGGPTLANLANAGRVRELRPGALIAASTAFGWHRAPSAIEIF
jgi:predicted acetyltransferase